MIVIKKQNQKNPQTVQQYNDIWNQVIENAWDYFS